MSVRAWALMGTGAALALVLGLSAAPASAGMSYAGCLHTPDPSSCIVDKAIDAAGALPWTDRMADLVQSGDVDGVLKLAPQVRPLGGILGHVRLRPTETDIAGLDALDPEGAKALREAAATDASWTREIGAHGAAFATRPLPPAAVAGYVLAAAAYRSADPFADPQVQAALAQVPQGPESEQRVLLGAMRAIRPDNQAYAVTPPGARAVLARAQATAKPPSAFTAALANFAWWAGDDAATRAALEALKADPAASALYWRVTARLWAAVGEPAAAQALIDTHGEGRDKVLAEVAIGDAWLRQGDKVRARAAAHVILSEGGDDPAAWLAAPQLLARAGAQEEAASSAQALGARAESMNRGGRSTALAAASVALAGIGETDEACRLAHRSLATVNDSAAAQVADWKARYGGTQIPLNIWMGIDFSGDPIPVEDVRAAFHDQAAAALAACGKRGADGKADTGAWRAVVLVPDASLSPAERLKTAAALARVAPATAAKLADAAAQAPEPEDPVARLMWRDGMAYALAAAGRGDDARAMAASAVRGLDELTNPEDRQAAGLVLARDHLALDALASGHGAFGRRLP